MTDTDRANGMIDEYASSAEAVDLTLTRVVVKIMISTNRQLAFWIDGEPAAPTSTPKHSRSNPIQLRPHEVRGRHPDSLSMLHQQGTR